MIKTIAVTWLAITIVFASILVAWAFVRWFDMVMLHVSLGAIFGMIATLPIWLLFKVAYRPTVTRCNTIDGKWRVVQ